MGYQESLLFCENKQDFKKLCRVLNSARPEYEGYIDVYAIGKLKKLVKIVEPFTNECVFLFSEDTYFAWLGGERYPYQGDNALTEYMNKKFGQDYTSWIPVFCEYIEDIRGFLKDIDQNKTGVRQENTLVSIYELSSGEKIKPDYIMKL